MQGSTGRHSPCKTLCIQHGLLFGGAPKISMRIWGEAGLLINFTPQHHHPLVAIAVPKSLNVPILMGETESR